MVEELEKAKTRRRLAIGTIHNRPQLLVTFVRGTYLKARAVFLPLGVVRQTRRRIPVCGIIAAEVHALV